MKEGLANNPVYVERRDHIQELFDQWEACDRFEGLPPPPINLPKEFYLTRNRQKIDTWEYSHLDYNLDKAHHAFCDGFEKGYSDDWIGNERSLQSRLGLEPDGSWLLDNVAYDDKLRLLRQELAWYRYYRCGQQVGRLHRNLSLSVPTMTSMLRKSWAWMFKWVGRILPK
jgi:hypothetical protein